MQLGSDSHINHVKSGVNAIFYLVLHVQQYSQHTVTHILLYVHDVRHCIDVMHIEKNVCDSVLGILLNMKDKTKDDVNARLDMVDMGIRPELAPLVHHNGKLYCLPTCYTLSKAEKTEFCTFLHGVKVPSGYSANIKRLVPMKDLKLIGMKAHDCHVMMTQILPIAIRNILPLNVL